MNNLVNKGAKNATQFARPTLPFVQQKPGPKVGSTRMPTQYAAMGGGIARMPRQNFTNMADGGIVGFKEGTDKFKDCSLKLYSQSLDLAEKQNQQVVVQSQGSSDTIRVIDVTRERENTLRKAGGLIDGSCTIATYYKC